MTFWQTRANIHYYYIHIREIAQWSSTKKDELTSGRPSTLMHIVYLFNSAPEIGLPEWNVYHSNHNHKHTCPAKTKVK